MPWVVAVVVFHYWVSCRLVDFLVAFFLLRMTLLLLALMLKSGWLLFLLPARTPLAAESCSRTSIYINNLECQYALLLTQKSICPRW